MTAVETEAGSFVLTGTSTGTPTQDIDLADIPEPKVNAMDRIRAQVKEQRTKALASLTFRIPVPRMPMVVVEYGCVERSAWNGLLEMAVKTKMEPLEVNSRLLALHCRGVYFDTDETDANGDPVLVAADFDRPDGPPPVFSKQLAETLGLGWTNLAYEFVQELYLADGDIISTAAAVLDLSGYERAAEIGATVLGN